MQGAHHDGKGHKAMCKQSIHSVGKDIRTYARSASGKGHLAIFKERIAWENDFKPCARSVSCGEKRTYAMFKERNAWERDIVQGVHCVGKQDVNINEENSIVYTIHPNDNLKHRIN